MAVKLKRYAGNPILSPHPGHAWEDLAVFNPAAWYDEDKKEVLMLYRAAEDKPEYRCWFGLARSKDGYNFQRVSDEPVFGPSGDGFDGATIQDPRITKMGDWFYVTYACRPFPFGQFWHPEIRARFVAPDVPPEFPRHLRKNATLTGLAMTKDFRTWQRAGWITDPVLDDRDAILFPERINGKFVLMHRPLEFVGPGFGVEKACAWIKESDDLLGLAAAPSKLLLKQKYQWEVNKLGMNTPPIRTRHGWLTIFHVVGADLHYRLGAVLLDLDDPSKVLHRTPDWLMEPEEDYEIEGYYRGCCFPCGTVVIDGTLFVYYGAADRYCAVATCDLNELLEHLLTCPN